MMKFILISMLFFMTANATDFSGVYYRNGATIEIVNKKSVMNNYGGHEGDIEFYFKSGSCEFSWDDYKRNIQGNKIIVTDDQGYGPMKYVAIKFTKNGLNVEMTEKMVTDYQCYSGTEKTLSGAYKKK